MHKLFALLLTADSQNAMAFAAGCRQLEGTALPCHPCWPGWGMPLRGLWQVYDPVASSF